MFAVTSLPITSALASQIPTMPSFGFGGEFRADQAYRRGEFVIKDGMLFFCDDSTDGADPVSQSFVMVLDLATSELEPS